MSESSNDSTMVESVVQQAERLLADLSSVCTKENTDVCIECEEKKFICPQGKVHVFLSDDGERQPVDQGGGSRDREYE